MQSDRSWRGVLWALVAVTLACAALYAAGSAALERQQRSTLAMRLDGDAVRIGRWVAARWGDLRWSVQPCLLPEPSLMAVWRRDGVELCRSEAVSYYRESVLTALSDRALAGERAEEAWQERDARWGSVTVLARARPVRVEAQAVATVIVVAALEPLEVALSALRWGLALAWLVACAAALGFEAWRRRRLVALLGDAAGVLEGLVTSAGAARSATAPVRASAEEAWGARLRSLAAAAVGQREALTERLEQREAVLASMAEGVLAVDREGRLIDLNPAAARMFDLEPPTVRGRDLLEVLRHPELQRFVRQALTDPAPVERELTLYDPEPRILRARGTGLRDAQGRGLGTLVVLHDVTRLRRLERLRQDFVANVSHELKTPITSIKGFVETLLDGALDNQADARRFLEIVARHAERLNAITEDLLSLSRIEQEAERGELHTERTELVEVLEGAVSLCAVQAQARHIAVATRCAPDLSARINRQLAEQAVVNLLDNALKFAPEGSTVQVEARREGAEVVLCVADAGPGIPAEHLPRLFERFYRVDAARSRGQRSSGGTGLGLAIVKHIAQAHGGRVEVSSQPGAGSTFTVRLPARDGEDPRVSS